MANKRLSANLAQLVDLLQDGCYHSGQVLAEQLGLSRNAVWKLMQQLVGFGVAVERKHRVGYRLQDQLILLDDMKILQGISPDVLCAEKLAVFADISSTNAYLMSLPGAELQLRACVSEQQSQGRGRLGRQWYSPFGQNIYLSLRWDLQCDPSQLTGLSIAFSLAIVTVLEQLGIVSKLKLKWPNDVLYEARKLAGLLVEIQAEAHGLTTVVLGVGLNVNMLNDGAHIDQSWASLRQILQQYIDRNTVVSMLITALQAALNRFLTDGFAVFAVEWDGYDCLRGKQVKVGFGDNVIAGEVVGLNRKGHLSLRLKSGKLVNCSSGDATIIKSSVKRAVAIS